MALGKTITYTPFQETSFGYGSGEIASAHSTEFPNATDIVKVVIDFTTGTNWDYLTGHIATPSVGTAVSTFNKFNMEWLVKGERDDVDAVLAQLKFFPSDYEATRTWTPTALKDNQTTGLYANEEPPTIPDTQMGLRVYDANDSLVQLYTINWEADNYSYDNNRPYWSVEPTSQDVSSLGIPPLIDLGTIANSTDENLTVKCEFRNYGSTSTYTGSAYGSFTQQSRFYVGEKKEGTRNTTDARFNFTGSLTETQAFLDNIGYNENQLSAFDMFLTVTDGAVGSTLTKTCWFSNAPFTVSHQLPDLVGTEDQSIVGLNADPNFTITHSPEVNRYWFTINLDATAQDGITAMSEGTLTNGVYTSDYSYSIQSLRAKMLTITMSLRDDFNDDFTFTIQWHGDNTTVGSSYSSASQSVNVTMTDTLEISNLFSSHSFSEDTRYTFSDGAGLPNIAHGYNRQYTARITASDPNAVETIWTGASGYTQGVDFFWENGDQLRMVGTRDDVNAMLNAAYFEPATDYDQNFTFSYHQTRLSGDTTSDEAEGDYYNIEIGANNCISMTCAVSHDEYSFTASTQNWEEDVSKLFDTGIRVTDLSGDHEYTTSYGTTYTVYMKMVDGSGNDYNVGSLTSTSTGGAIGNAGGSNPKTYTGTKAQVNQAITNMKYVPTLDTVATFYIQFKIVRDFDSEVFVDYDQSRQITMIGQQIDEITNTSVSMPWDWNTAFEFDSQTLINDSAADNTDYNFSNTNYQVTIRAKYWDGVTSQPLTTATWATTSYGSATVSGSGTVADPLIITGSKTDCNTALANLQLQPDVDWRTSPAADGSFWIEARVERLEDNTLLLNFETITSFPEGTQTTGLTIPWGQIDYNENIPLQSLFSNITTVTEELDDYVSNVTYSVIVTLTNGYNTGFMSPRYSDDDYVTPNNIQKIGSDDPNDNYVNDYTLNYIGTRSEVNSAVQAIQFTPYLDTITSSGIHLTVKRFINGQYSKNLTTALPVGDINGVSSSDFVYGTANSNIQYFVSGKNFVGIANPDTVSYDLSNAVSVNLTPKQIALNKGYNYDRPITVTDTFEQGGGPSQYKITFSGLSSLQYNNSYMDKESLNAMLDNGIHTLSDFTYSNGTQTTVSFTLHRRTYDGVENQFAQGTLTYQYVSGHRLKIGSSYFPTVIMADTYYSSSDSGDRLTVVNDDGTAAADGLGYAFEYIGLTYDGGSSTQSVGYLFQSSTEGRWYRSGAGAVRQGWDVTSGDFDSPFFWFESFNGSTPYGDPINNYGRHYSVVIWNGDGIIERFGSQNLFTGARLITYKS